MLDRSLIDFSYIKIKIYIEKGDEQYGKFREK